MASDNQHERINITLKDNFAVVNWYMHESALRNHKERIGDTNFDSSRKVLRCHDISGSSSIDTEVDIMGGTQLFPVEPGKNYGFELGILCQSKCPEKEKPVRGLESSVEDLKIYTPIVVSTVVQVPPSRRQYRRHSYTGASLSYANR